MCRLMAYIGPPRLIADVVLWPDRSIIKQSYDARERLQDPSLPNHLGFGNLNGDGFGIGWYAPDDLREGDPTPCMYKSITPAWNNENLARLSCKIISPLVFAHVRAAYPGMPVSEQNCHPFQWGRYIWMHNGVVGGFSRIKRRLLDQLSDAAYNSIQSFHSDSAVSFAVFLNHLPDLVQQQPPNVLLNAMQAAISTITRVQDQMGISDVSLLNFVVSDGATMIATRFVRPETEAAATLYYAEGASFDRLQPQQQQHHASASAKQDGAAGAAAGVGGEDAINGCSSSGGCPVVAAAAAGQEGGVGACGTQELVGSSVLCEASYGISYSERGASVAFVASEPITGSTTDWVCVPKNTVLVVTREKGGFLSVLQSSLSTGNEPDPRLAEVSTCLASIAQGVHTKSRAWVASRPQHSQGGWASAGGVVSSPPGGLDGLMSPRGTDSFMGGLLGMGKGPEPETVTMEEEHMLTGHTKSVLALVTDEPSSRLYTSSADATVRAWDLTDMSCVAVIRGHSKPVTKLQLLAGRLLFTAAGGAVRVWDTRSFVCLAKVRTSYYSGAIRSMLVTADGTVYVGHQDMTVKKFLPLDAASNGCGGSGDGIIGVADSLPVSPRITAAGAASAHAHHHQQGPVRPPDAQTDPKDGHVGPVNDLVACGPYICSAGGDTTVRVWRASDLSLVRVLRGHRGSVLCLLAVGNVLLSGARDNTIRVWDLDLDFVCRRTLLGHKDDVVHLDALGLTKAGPNSSSHSHATQHVLVAPCSSPEPGSVAAADGGGSGSIGGSIPRPSSRLGMSPGSGYSASVLVASASADGTVRVWSSSSWTCLRILTICVPTHVGGGGDGWSDSPSWAHQQQQRQQQHRHQQQQSTVGAATRLLTGQPSAAAAAAVADGKCNGSSAAATTGHSTGTYVAAPNGQHSVPAAVVTFADDVVDHTATSTSSSSHVQQTQQQQPSPLPPQQQQQQEWQERPELRDPFDVQLRASFQSWVPADAQQQQQEQLNVQPSLQDGMALQQLQLEQPSIQQPPPQQPAALHTPQQHHSSSSHQQQQQQQPQQALARQGSLSRRQQKKLNRQRAHMPTTAALVVGISARHIVGGYSDATIRLWHMDDVYLADLTEQLVTGQIQQSDLALLQEQLMPLNATSYNAFGSFNPFAGLSLSNVNLTASSSSLGKHASLDLSTSSPPLSPGGLSQIAGQLVTHAFSTASQLLREGSGAVLGVELLEGSDKVRRRGCWCARLRDNNPSRTSSNNIGHLRSTPSAGGGAATVGAGGITSRSCGGTSPSPVPASPRAAADAGVDAAAMAAGVAPAALSKPLQCLACGSQDQQLVRALKDFVAIRTVSNNKALHDECLRGAKFVSKLLDALGAEVKMAQPYDGKNPVVLGRLGHNPACPTVAFYGHYDIQPAEEPDWRTNPFEMTAVDGYLCGRGTSDNKGPMLAFIYAVKELLDCWRLAGASCPLNFAFMFEGEEENGSLGFQESVAANLDWFSDAVLVVISNTVWVGEHRPCLTYGMRGMVTASLVVHGPERDLHSGNDGGVFNEPMADLVQLLGSLHGPGGKISVPGFSNNVRPQLMELAWQGLEDSEEFSMDSYREAIGVPQLTTPPSKFDLLNARWCSPTLSIVDIRTTASSYGQPAINPAAAAAATTTTAAVAAAGVTASDGSSQAATPPMQSPRQVSKYAHSPAAAGQAGSGSGNFSSVAAALNLGLQPVLQQQQQQSKLPALRLPLGGCVHGHHCGDNKALWPSIVPVTPGSGGAGGGGGGGVRVSHLGGAAGFGGAADGDRSCYRFGPTRFSVIPKVAVGKISLRFVPEQDHQTLIECLQTHLEKRFEQLWSANKMELQVHSVGDWWEADPKSQLFQMAERAVQREWGVDPLYVREGGTMPVASLIEKMLGAPALMIPMGQSSDNCHLANERLRRVNLIKGKNVVRHLLEEVIAAAGGGGGAGAATAAAASQQPAGVGGGGGGSGDAGDVLPPAAAATTTVDAAVH